MGELVIDYPRRRVTLEGRALSLTGTEYRLLCELALHAGRTLSLDHLMGRVWSARESTDSRVVAGLHEAAAAEAGGDRGQPHLHLQPAPGGLPAGPGDRGLGRGGLGDRGLGPEDRDEGDRDAEEQAGGGPLTGAGAGEAGEDWRGPTGPGGADVQFSTQRQGDAGMTINNQDDFLQALRDNPQWRDAVRAEILGEELLQLPALVARFVQTTEENFRLVNARLERLEGDVAGLKTGQAEIRNDVAELQAGQARLEAGQAEIRNDVAELQAGQARLEAGQAEIRNDVAELQAGQTRLESRLGNLIGADYERQVSRSARLIFWRSAALRNIAEVQGPHARDGREVYDILGAAIDNDTITPDEAEDVFRADMILKAVTPEGEEVYVVCETAVTAYRDDLTRALARARTLQTASGVRTVPVVIGQSLPEGTALEAEELGVQLIRYLEPGRGETPAAENGPDAPGPDETPSRP